MSQLDSNVVLHASGTGAPVVLLHCLGVDHHFWDFAAPLEDELRLLRYDLPGHGATPVPPAGYTIEDLSAQLAAILQRNGIARAHLAGISLGGLIAQHFAATCPGMVDHLMLVDTTPRYDDELRRMWGLRADTARKQGVGALVEGLLPIWFSAERLAAENAGPVRYVREALARTSGEGYALACEALAAADLRPLVSRIKAPTMVVCGDNDIPSFLEAARWLASNIASARLSWIPKTRHASMIEAPERALQLMRDFFLATCLNH
jgi:3-oxoadipate enol-lactonase